MLPKNAMFVVGAALFALVLPARGQDNDEYRAIALKAMEAHGGKKVLSKYPAAQVKYKGTLDFMGMDIKMSGEVFFQFPDKMRNVIAMEINNMNIDVVTVFDGKAFWVKAAGQLMEMKDEKLIEETKENVYSEKVASLFDLDDPGYKFAALGDAKINGKETVGIRVSREGRRDVNLYFDKQTNLLAKYEARGKEPFTMMEANQEKLVSDYKTVQGIKTASKLVVSYDGKKMMELSIVEATYSERLDESLFMKP